MKISSWDECEMSDFAREVLPDLDRANSLIEVSLARVKLIKSVNPENCNFVFEDYYTSVLELMQALVIKKGYNVSNHLCLGYYLRDIVKKEHLYDLFDDLRYKRNSLTYYGDKMDFEVAKSAIKDSKELIKALNKLF